MSPASFTAVQSVATLLRDLLADQQVTFIWQHNLVSLTTNHLLHYRRIGLCKSRQVHINGIRASCWTAALLEQRIRVLEIYTILWTGGTETASLRRCCVCRHGWQAHAKTHTKKGKKKSRAGAAQTIPRHPTVFCVQVATLINICLSTYHLSYSSAGHWGSSSTTARWMKQNMAD